MRHSLTEPGTLIQLDWLAASPRVLFTFPWCRNYRRTLAYPMCYTFLVRGLQVHPAIPHAPSFYVGSDKLNSGSTLGMQYFSN